MFRIETPPLARLEAERFKTAFYRFLETNPPPMEEAAWLEVSMVDGGERHSAQLWSQDAVDAFSAYTAAMAAPTPSLDAALPARRPGPVIPPARRTAFGRASNF